MPVQDDAREIQLRQLFNLQVAPERKRADVDAALKIDGLSLDFELKSTTSGTVSTVRDFGMDHVRKWRDKHWIFGFYDKSGTELLYCCYASPALMTPWIQAKERYVRPDQILADAAPTLLGPACVIEILGEQEVYTLANARSIMKKQWNAQAYHDAQDVPGGYSLDRMTEIIRERCRYVIMRGSTLNNPHIEKAYFASWPKIMEDHAATLRGMVREFLQQSDFDGETSVPAPDGATPLPIPDYLISADDTDEATA